MWIIIIPRLANTHTRTHKPTIIFILSIFTLSFDWEKRKETQRPTKVSLIKRKLVHESTLTHTLTYCRRTKISSDRKEKLNTQNRKVTASTKICIRIELKIKWIRYLKDSSLLHKETVVPYNTVYVKLIIAAWVATWNDRMTVAVMSVCLYYSCVSFAPPSVHGSSSNSHSIITLHGSFI